MALPTEGADLQIIPWISPGRIHILLDVKPERDHHINYDWGTHREKGNVNEPHANSACRDAQFFTDSRTHPERMPLNKVFNLVHVANLIFFDFQCKSNHEL